MVIFRVLRSIIYKEKEISSQKQKKKCQHFLTSVTNLSAVSTVSTLSTSNCHLTRIAVLYLYSDDVSQNSLLEL
jgi:hypothetical protein